ncbi:MAG: ribosomal L7Ae/L30e/S12e/Gadd45 family protein [Ruminococcus sp.]|nr:ribosomal L7Ae/L30e/S12e/Gadd45 family protein [Ruminococcus sp.]
MNSQSSLKTANLLGICIKVCKTVRGFVSVCEAVKKGTVFCVLTACDASEKTIKEISFICGKYDTAVYASQLSKDELAVLCGKTSAVIGVTDKGFSDGFGKILSE